METDLLDIRNMDCIKLMKEYPDGHFDLAIIDPPYGISECGDRNFSRGKLAVSKNYKAFHGNDSDSPEPYFFYELRRVSKNQIIFGANHFIDKIPIPSSCWIVWDKDNGECDFADCELAWTSFKTAVRRYKFRWAGMLQGDMKNKEQRIHPTQKPVKLYEWILSNYAEKGQTILDTHLGSGSIAIACHYFGCHLTASELDEYYYELACERIARETQQQTLF